MRDSRCISSTIPSAVTEGSIPGGSASMQAVDWSNASLKASTWAMDKFSERTMTIAAKLDMGQLEIAFDYNSCWQLLNVAWYPGATWLSQYMAQLKS